MKNIHILTIRKSGGRRRKLKDVDILRSLQKKMKQKGTNIISHEEAVKEIKKAEKEKKLIIFIAVSVAGILVGVICSYIPLELGVR